MEKLIRDVSDTARWVAVYRADESQRADAVFNDPYARRLAGERGEQIVAAMENGRQNSWSFVARTYLFDELIMQQVNNGFDVVINLAAGLDARPYRLPLPPTLLWIDVDLPQITSYMNEEMANENPKCIHKRIAADLANKEERIALLQQLENEGNKILIVAEGLVGYLKEDEVAALAKDLSCIKTFKRWILDLMSPGILPMIQKEMGGLLEEADAPLIFAPAAGELFFEHYGWKLIKSKSKLKTASLLNRLSIEMEMYAAYPEPEGPKGNFPWSGVCVFENKS